jgi:hypothetical protein
MKTLEEVAAVLKEITDDMAIASAEIPNSVEAKDIALYQITRVRAQERIRDNLQKYRFFVDSHIGLIIPQGPVELQKAFADKAATLGKTYTYNLLDTYRRLVAPTYAQMGGTGAFTPSNIADVYGMLRLLTRRDLNIFRFRDPEISWLMQISIKSMDQLAEGVRDSINRSSGHALIAKAINKYVADEAVKNPIARMVIPVVALEVADDEIAGLEKFYSKHTLVADLNDVEMEDVEKSVIEAFTQLKNQLK